MKWDDTNGHLWKCPFVSVCREFGKGLNAVPYLQKKMRRFSGFSGMKNSPTAQTLGFLLVNRLILVYGFKQFQKCELVNRDHCRKNGKT